MDNLDKVDAALLDKPDLLSRFSTYIKGTAPGAALEELKQKLAAAPSDLKEGVLGSIMEKLRAEGQARGRKQDLSRLLERRFGTLPAAVKARVAGADHDQLDAWVDRVLDAESLNAVFG